jgi:putative transcriptional regulator
MSKTITIVKMDKNGTLRRKGVALKAPRGRSLNDDQALTAAKADPDNPPLSKKRMTAMARTLQVKVLRRALGLTQQEFSARYQIPLGTLRDWEQGRATPDLPTRAYLKVIARDPKAVEKALERG